MGDPGQPLSLPQQLEGRTEFMNANAVVGMSNTFSALVNYTAAGVLEQHIDGLLLDSDETTLRIPLSGIEAKGAPAVKAEVLRLYAAEKGNPHLLHTAAWETDGMPEDEGMANWNTYSYRAASRLPGGEAGSAAYQFVRLTVGFKRCGGRWRIKSIYALPLMTLAPWDCSAPDIPGSMQGGPALEFPGDPFCEVDPMDFVKIRNIAGLFVHYAPQYAMEYFSTSEEVRVDILGRGAAGQAGLRDYFARWKAGDDATGYLSRKLTVANPVIAYTGNRDRAELWGMGHLFDSEVTDPQALAFACTRRVVAVYITFVRENGSWRIMTLKAVPVLSIGREANDTPRMLEAMPSRVADYFPSLDPDNAGLSAADVFEIESILPQWTERLKRGDLPTFPDPYMVNGIEEISLSMRQAYVGYDEVMDRCEGLISRLIVGKEDMLRFPQFHSGCTPVIVSDGSYAQGIWMDIAWGNIGAAIYYEDSQKEREYLPGIGQYTHSFVKGKDGWRMYQLADRSIPVPPMVDWKYHIDEVGGWSVAQQPKLWPLPFEVS